jgi:GT2 family glycosyltransferase
VPQLDQGSVDEMPECAQFGVRYERLSVSDRELAGLMNNVVDEGAEQGAVRRIAVVMASHNRREMTLRILEQLSEVLIARVELSVFLCDDGSTDGTPEEIAKRLPLVRITSSDGSLFWSQSMHRAWAMATEEGGDWAAFVWLNDDVELDIGAFSEFLALGLSHPDDPVILVGATVDDRGDISYGGYVSTSSWHPNKFRLLAIDSSEQKCDTFNGNIDPNFEHSMGDFDYGLRAAGLGVNTRVTPGVIGKCNNNPTRPFTWAMAFDRKQLPWRSHLLYVRRHGGIRWPLAFVSPYLSALLRAGRPRHRGTRVS